LNQTLNFEPPQGFEPTERWNDWNAWNLR